jgi:F420-0:gamma-glutamyl ligase
VFSEKDLVVVSNNIGITRFNNNADTANAPREINLLPTNSVRTITQLLLNFVGNSVLVLRE